MWKHFISIFQRKRKYFDGIISPTLIKHWEKLLWNVLNLKIKQIKRKTLKIISSIKNNVNYVVKLSNESRQEHFDSLNPFVDSKPFWKSCKPYLSNKHSFGDSKIALNESGEIFTGNIKIAKPFNSYFESISDSLELFDWSLQSNISDGKEQNILKNFSNHPSIIKINRKSKSNKKFSFQYVSEATVRKLWKLALRYSDSWRDSTKRTKK